MIGWLQWQGDKLGVSWGVYNLFLTPAHNWVHDYMWDWTCYWYPNFNMMTVWSNRRQGIIYMLSGWTVGRFREPIWGKRTKVKTLGWRIKVVLLCFCIFPYFWFPRLSSLPTFSGLSVFRNRGTKNTGYTWISPCYGLVKQHSTESTARTRTGTKQNYCGTNTWFNSIIWAQTKER